MIWISGPRWVVFTIRRNSLSYMAVGWLRMIAQIAKTERRHAIAPGTSAQAKKLRVLIPYDGSETAEATLQDLSRAGLPRELDALIAITQVWLPSSPYEITSAVSARRLKLLTSGLSPMCRRYRSMKNNASYPLRLSEGCVPCFLKDV